MQPHACTAADAADAPEGVPAAFDVAIAASLLREDLPAAIAYLAAGAEAGDATARFVSAQMLMEARGVAPDHAKAFHLFALAANDGHAEAMNLLGRCHELGQGTPANLELAAVWYGAAARAGLDWGRYNLANLLATGRGVARDGERALSLYRTAALQGHAKSMNLFARHLEEGWHVAQDPAEALAWYRRSAAAGDFRGQASLASILADQGDLAGAEALLRAAIPNGSPAFLAQMRTQLGVSRHPRLRALLYLCGPADAAPAH